MASVKKIPNLRFPGFDGAWEEDELGNLVEVSKKKFNPNTKETILPCIELEHLEQGSGRLLSHSFSDEQRSVKNYFHEGEILFGKLRPYLKKYWKATFEGVCSSEIIVLNGTKISNNYLFNIVQLQKFNEIANVSSGSKMPRADWNYMKEHPFHFPPLPEQQKIADCLTAMDDTIEAQQRKVEQLQAYKKGLLQQLFSQTLRFPGFEGEWEEKKLGEVVQDKKKGNTPDYENPKNLLLNNDFMENQAAPMYVGNDINVKSNDLLILWDGSQAGKVYTGFEGVLGSTFVAINFDSDTSHLFIYNVLRHNLLAIQRVWREGSGIPHIAKDFIENYKIQLPSFPEQQKIADCLSTLDEVIELEQQKLEKLQVYKKGLLQQLFV